MERSEFPRFIEEKIREKGLFEIIASTLFLTITLSTGIISFVFTTVKFKEKKFPSFLVYPNRIVSLTKNDEWQAIIAGIQPLDTVIEVNGRKINHGSEVYEIVRTLPYFTVKVKRGSEIVERQISVSKFSNSDYIIMVVFPFIVGMGFLIIGSVVYFATKKDIHVLLFFILSVLVALFFFAYISANFDHIFYRLWFLYPFFGAVGIHLFGIFPVEHPSHRLETPIIIFVYTIALLLVLLMEFSFSNPEVFEMVFKIATALMGIAFLGLIFMFFDRLRKTTSPLVRRKLRVLFFAIICASSIAGIWSIMFPFATPFLSTEKSVLLSLVFPIITGYAVLKYNVFDIDRFIRTGLSVGIISAVLIGVYLAMIVITVLVTERVFKIQTSPFNIAIATLTVAIIFHPLRIKVKELILSTFYREELRFKSILDKFLELPRYFDRYPDIIRRLIKLFEGELGIIPFCVFVKEPGSVEFKEMTSCFNSISPPLSEETKGLINSSSLLKIRGIYKLRDNLEDEFERNLFREGYRLAVPLHGKSGLFAIMFLGERLPGEMYSPEELKYLHIFAERITLIFENALIYEEMVKKEGLALIGEMASIMIHDIKNPMGIIRVAVETLEKRRKYQDAREQELFSIVRKEMERMDATIRKILTYAKYESPSMKEENIEEIVKEVEREFSELLRRRNIEFIYTCNCDDTTLLVDREKIKSLLSNLISNAVDSIESNGKIEINIQKVNDNGREWLDMTVKDNGKGIPRGMEREIFKPFFSTKTGGTGLGLAICERIVKDHGGTIEALDNIEGGAVFHIKIPWRRKDAENSHS